MFVLRRRQPKENVKAAAAFLVFKGRLSQREPARQLASLTCPRGPRRRPKGGRGGAVGAASSHQLQAAFVTAAELLGERTTKGPHHQKALFMLNLAHALYSLSPHGAGDKKSLWAQRCFFFAERCPRGLFSTLADSHSGRRDPLSLLRRTIKH